MASDLADEVRAASLNVQKNSIALAASHEVLKRMLERFKSYRARIDEAFRDETWPLDSRDYVMAVFGDLVSILDDGRRQIATERAAQAPFQAGMDKAVQLLENRVAREQRAARAAEAIEAEEDEYRVDLAERTAPQAVEDDSEKCAHCSEPITMATGSENCSACVSHCNRYGALPSKQVLKKRRERNRGPNT